MNSKSEVARLMQQIQEEYAAALNGLSGVARGVSKHAFITARMENMGKLAEKIGVLEGGESIAYVFEAMQIVEEGLQAQQ